MSDFGGSPRTRRPWPPLALRSRQVRRTAPPSSRCQSERTFQMRSRTAALRSGAVYTPGATSSITEARKPRKRGATSRVTTTVIGIEELLDAVDHRGDHLRLAEGPAGDAAHLPVDRKLRLALGGDRQRAVSGKRGSI